MSLRQRFPTAMILLSLLVVVVQWASNGLFFLVLQAVIVAALVEFYGLARRRKLEPRPAVGIPLALLIGASFFFQRFPLQMALLGGLVLAGIFYLIATDSIEKVVAFPTSIAVTLFGAVYTGLTLNYLYTLRVERGPFHLYFFFSVIFLGDSGAFLFGKTLGRHKMTPLASPNKTWEGAVGGLLFALIGAFAARTVFLPSVSAGSAALAGVLVHAVAQISDPLESLFKRAAGVKDSSNLLPGHGGFLDRVDSFLLAAPFFYYYIRFFWT
jgi:phosphatidate cytidylyltransferase